MLSKAFTSLSEFFSFRISVWCSFWVLISLVKYSFCLLTIFLNSLNCLSFLIACWVSPWQLFQILYQVTVVCDFKFGVWRMVVFFSRYPVTMSFHYACQLPLCPGVWLENVLIRQQNTHICFSVLGVWRCWSYSQIYLKHHSEFRQRV